MTSAKQNGGRSADLAANVMAASLYFLGGGVFLVLLLFGEPPGGSLGSLALFLAVICAGFALSGFVIGFRYLLFASRIMQTPAGRTPVVTAEAFLRASMPRIMRPSSPALAWACLAPGLRDSLDDSDALTQAWTQYASAVHSRHRRASTVGLDFSPPSTRILPREAGATSPLRAVARFQVISVGSIPRDEGERSEVLGHADAELYLVEIGGRWYVDGWSGKPFPVLRRAMPASEADAG